MQKGVGGSGDITPVDRERYQGIIDFISPELSGKDVRIVDVGLVDPAWLSVCEIGRTCGNASPWTSCADVPCFAPKGFECKR